VGWGYDGCFLSFTKTERKLYIMNYDLSLYYKSMPVMFLYTIHKNTIILQRNCYYIIYIINLKLTSLYV